VGRHRTSAPSFLKGRGRGRRGTAWSLGAEKGGVWRVMAVSGEVCSGGTA
jgi:hypothetical protein